MAEQKLSIRLHLLMTGFALWLAACSSVQPLPPVTDEVEQQPVLPSPEPQTERARSERLERQLAEKRRSCAEERKKLEAMLRELQKKADDTQKKLDALIDIERQARRAREK